MWGAISSAVWVLLILYLVGFRFKKPLDLLIARVKSLGPQGAQFDAPAQADANRAIPKSGDLKQLPGIKRTPAVTIVEKRLYDSIDAQKIPNDQREDYLVLALAQTLLVAHFARTYNTIFGSQILGLKRLNLVNRVSLEDAGAFYNQYKEQYPQLYNSYPFDKWLGFLQSQELLVRRDGFVEITEIGREFLVYLTEQRLVEEKPY